MANILIPCRNICRVFSVISSNKISTVLKCNYSLNNEKDNAEEDDILDDFTSKLLQRKTEKWENKKFAIISQNKSSFFNNNQHETTDLDIKNLDINKVNSFLQTALENEDYSSIFRIINDCIKLKKCPTLSVLIPVLSIFAQKGDKETVEKIRDLCDELEPQMLESNSHFNHYLAEAIWIKGNIVKSLEIFETVYRENPYLRRRVRLMLKNLISQIVTNRSEAALFIIIKFAEKLQDEFTDFFPLTCIWQVCFLSEWFTDQKIALDLLDKNEALRKALVNRIPYVVMISLRNHKTEVVYRLLEILLIYNMKLQYSNVLLALFDFELRKGNIQRCTEIINWSMENDINLPAIQHGKFIKLLLKKGDQILDENFVKSTTKSSFYKF